MEYVDLDKSRELKKHIESLTHSGSKELNREELNRVLEICSEKEYLNEVKEDIKKLLKKNHSEIRFSTTQLIHEFFMKFEEFRNFILSMLDEFFKLTLGLQSIKDLPPPKAAAQALRKLSLSCLLIWENTFLTPKLRRAIKYLADVEHIDFESLEVVDPKERKEKEEWELRMHKLNMERLKKMNEEVDDILPEVHSTITSLESCFELLMPLPDETCNINEASDSDLRLFGIINSKHSVQIEIRDKLEIKVDDENSSVIDAARDAYLSINNRFLPKIKAWVEIISKAGGGANLMQKALKVKHDLELLVSKYNRLDIVSETGKKHSDDEDEVSSDSDLEEVPDTKLSSRDITLEEISFLSPTLEKSKMLEKKSEKKEHSNQEESLAGPSPLSGLSERKAQLLVVAPKVPYDIDLYHWEDEKLPTPTVLAVSSEGSRFWGGGGSEELQEIPVPDGAASLRTRVIEFAGKWEPVTHTCRAPLPSGKLCPRKDRVKCPFHGIIVERDDTGMIISKEDEEKVAKSKTKLEVPDWQDPKLLADIKAQTGIDLKMPEKGKRTKKKKYPGLTDLKELKNTTEKRLSKKIFNKKSLKRVAETLDKIDHKRHRYKFGDQFNYVHNT